MMTKSLKITSNNPIHNNDLSNRREKNDDNHAVVYYKKELALKPESAQAHFDLATVLSRAGDHEGAIFHYRQAIRIKPDYFQAIYNLANLYKHKNDLIQAVKYYRTAVAINPGLVDAFINLGIVYHLMGKSADAEASYNKAIELMPDCYAAWTNLSVTYRESENMGKAISCGKRAVLIRPDDPRGNHNLATAFKEAGQLEKALEYYQRAVKADPELVVAWIGMGIVFEDLGRFRQATFCFKNAFEKEPENTQALALYVNRSMFDCDWETLKQAEPILDQLTRRELENGIKTGEMPFLNLARHQNPLLNLVVARSWSRVIERRVADAFVLHRKPLSTDSSGKITIGYLSNNIRNHPTAHLISGLFENHDRSQFNVYCYSYGDNDNSAFRRKIIHDCDRFIDLKMDTCRTAAMRINKDKVDILVDLTGYMKGGRPEICAFRPAPIQVRWLGMAGTTGAGFYDYLIADRMVVPKNHQKFYMEKIVYMPHCYQVNNDRQVIAELDKQRKDFGLPESGFVFASFNTAYKIDESIFSCWMRLLKQVPGSVLWLMAGSPTTERNLLHHAEKLGINSDRIVFAAKIPKENHLARLYLADLALDTKAVSGAATTSDALMAGVPVLTIKGKHFASRMSSSILAALGLDDLVTDNLCAYEKKAADLALNPDEYAKLKKRLLKNRIEKPLFQTADFVEHLEIKYLDMFHQVPSTARENKSRRLHHLV